MRTRVRDWLVAAAVLFAGRGEPSRDDDGERLVPRAEPNPRAELLALGLLLACAAFAAGFVAIYALDRLPDQTQLLGASLGLSFLCLAAALIVTAKRLVVTEELEEGYPAIEHREEQEAVGRIVDESGSGLTRRRLFKLCLGAAGGSLAVALVTPAASLGPLLDLDPFYRTPWKRGRRLVDEQGRPYLASEIEEKAFYTAFPEGADPEAMGSPIVVVRLGPDELHLPPANARYDADGIVAYSKICTHAGCAISLYRAPLFRPTEPAPALVCPCHYSTFDPARAGKVTFGPAGRKLPMLPLAIDRSGHLRAAGNFDEPVGPSWWGVRLRKARS